MSVVPHSKRVSAINHISKVSTPLVKEEFLHPLWQQVALQLYYEYANEFLFQEVSAPFAALKEFIRVCIGRPKQRDVLLAYHILACESHLEVVQTALRVLSGVERDVRTDYWNDFLAKCQIELTVE